MTIAILDNPNEDGHIKWDGAYTRNTVLPTVFYGGVGQLSAVWLDDWRAYVEWDISTLAGKILTANPIFKYHGAVSAATDEEINPLLEEAPSGATDENLYGYIATGVAYVNPFNHEVGETKQVDLGAQARADLQAAMDAHQAWFAIGFQSPADEGTKVTELRSGFYSEDKTDPVANPKPTLYVDYTPPTVTVKPSGNIAVKMVEAGLI
ncbi:unnamed protein product [marine sediment metagenome]|uniref:Uncharacterized protein n=1 Tax=marine sediment metagenome TaxID=412755 RepID=X1KZQ2_9ZZZZ